jgi:hypothetical protein
MNKVNAKSTFGNFKWTATAEVSDSERDVLADLGFLWIMQRTPSSNAEKAMAGYEKRPKDFKRASIEYSDEKAVQLQSELNKNVEIAEGVKITPVVGKVEFHEIGAGAVPKFVEEIRIADRHVKAGDFAQWMTDAVGVKATVADYENEKTRTEVLQAIKEFTKAMLANA